MELCFSNWGSFWTSKELQKPRGLETPWELYSWNQTIDFYGKINYEHIPALLLRLWSLVYIQAILVLSLVFMIRSALASTF